MVDSDYEGENGFLLILYGQGGVCLESTKFSVVPFSISHSVLKVHGPLQQPNTGETIDIRDLLGLTHWILETLTSSEYGMRNGRGNF